MKTILSKIKLFENVTELQVKEWSNTLNQRKKDVLESLENEGVFIESAFLDRHENGQLYLYYFMKMEDEEKCRVAAQNSTLDIDFYHKDFKKKCWERGERLECLINFERAISFHKIED
jgi:hypothetical protein